MYRRIFSLLMLTALFAGIPHVSTAGRKADIEIANRVAQWQIDNFGNYFSKGLPRSDQHWANGALYRGMVVWAKRRATRPARSSCSPSAAATAGAGDGGRTMPTTSASDRLT